MQNLLKLLKVLESTEGLPVYNYAIPDIWNCFGYQGHERRSTPWVKCWSTLIISIWRWCAT